MPRNLIGSDTSIRAIKPGDARRRLSDGEGLYLLLFVKGGAHGWRLDYSVEGKRKTLSLGTYPTVGLGLAREKADAARKLVAQGLDPSEARKAVRATHVKAREARRRKDAGLPSLDSFEHVAREWYEVRRTDWAESYGVKILGRLVNDVLARALRMYLAGSTDITANLGLRPRPGGRYEAPIASQSMRARNDAIKRLFHLQDGSNSVRAEKVAALLRAEPTQGEVTEEEMLGYAMRLHAEFGGTLPKSARQVLRVVLPGT